MKAHASRVLALAFASSLVWSGCGGGGSGGGGGASIAPSTSQTPTSTTSPTTSSSSTSPVASGTIATAAPVQATVTLDSFIALREKASASDMVLPADPLNKNKAFVLEDAGTLRVIDLAPQKPALVRAIPLDAAQLPQGCSLGALSFTKDGRLACATATGGGKEYVYILDPTIAKTASDVTRLDFSGVKLTFASAFQNSNGQSVGTTLSPTYTASALIAGGKLFVCSSNIDAQFAYNPGTVMIFDIDTKTLAVSNGRFVTMSQWNPTRLALWTAPTGEEAVLVTASGALNSSGASQSGASAIDVLDVATAKLVASIPLGSGNVAGPVVVTPDRKRGFVGSTSASEVSALDLAGLEAELKNAQPTSLPQRSAGRIALPGSTQINYLSSLAVSASGKFLYAVNFNTSAVAIVDISGAQPGLAGTATGFARTGDPAKFEGTASLIGVRPGVPGVDFQGPAAFVATINLASQDRKLKDVSVSLDAVEFDKN